jgi:hypothetical protein
VWTQRQCLPVVDRVVEQQQQRPSRKFQRSSTGCSLEPANLVLFWKKEEKEFMELAAMNRHSEDGGGEWI